MQIEKEEVKLFLLSKNMIIYEYTTKKTHKPLLKLISEFGKVTGYQVNIQESIVFPYISNKQLENKKILNTIYNSIET